MAIAKSTEIFVFALPFMLGIPSFAIYRLNHPKPVPEVAAVPDNSGEPTGAQIFGGAYYAPSPTAVVLATKCKSALQHGATFVERMDAEKRCLCRHVADGVDPKMCRT